MDKETFVTLYNSVLRGDASNKVGGKIIREYIEEEGNEYQKEYSSLFLTIINTIPALRLHCLNHVLEHYTNKFSVVKVIKHDCNVLGMNTEQILFVY